MQDVPAGNVNIMGGHTIGLSKQNNVYMYMCVLLRMVSKIELFK